MNSQVDFHFKKPEESSGYLLWQVTMLWQRKTKKELDKIDLTHTQFVLLATLAWLSKQNDVVTQVEISNHSNTDRMMVSKVLRTLQAKSLINRVEDQNDTRAKNISLTKKGVEQLQVAIKIVEQVDQDFFGILDIQTQNFNLNMVKLMNQ